MDAARCTQNDLVYNALQFSQLPAAELAEKRRMLVCAQCGAQAFFRKASRHGRAACFGARPHEPGCDLATVEPEQLGGGGDDQEELINPGERIVVDFNFGAVNGRHGDDDGTPGVAGRGGAFVGDGDRPQARMHRRLSSLLRNLRLSEQFRASHQILEIDGHGEVTVRDFFLKFEDVRTAHATQYRGFWGMIADARLSEGDLWLNSGGRDNVSFCVAAERKEQLFERYGIEDLEQLAGAYALIFGTMHVSQNGKKYVVVEDVAFVALSLA